MDIMQAEALRRAQEMHRGRENNQNNRTTQTPQRDAKNRPGTNQPKSDSQEHTQVCVPAQKESAPMLFEDKEKLLILVLIMILCTEENSDPTLILALLYLII